VDLRTHYRHGWHTHSQWGLDPLRKSGCGKTEEYGNNRFNGKNEELKNAGGDVNNEREETHGVLPSGLNLENGWRTGL
jgi:hypothetical protein